MLTGIGLRNFKAFGDEMQEAPLSQITLIYGPNSGGKSSIIQTLLLLLQSSKVVDRGLAFRGEFVDLGSSQALLHKHETERELGISIKYRIKNNVAENDVTLTYSSSGELSNVRYKITSHEDKEILLDATALKQPDELVPGWHTPFDWQGNVKLFDPNSNDVIESNGIVLLSSELLASALFTLSESPLPVLALPGMNDARVQVPAQSFTPTHRSERYRLERAEKLARQLEDCLDAIDVPDDISKFDSDISELFGWNELGPKEALAPARELEQVRTQARELDRHIGRLNLSDEQILDLTPENIPYDYERLLRSVNYLAPLRSAPERLYRLSRENDVSASITGVQGEFSANALYQQVGLLSEVNRWFEKLGISYKLDVIKVGEVSFVGEHITIALTDKRTDTQVTLADVGYGINQILPVIIEGIASQEDSILCVEQPEIHLHPRLQANIADLMIDTIADEPGKGKQWIVETHSELLILRLQRRIREGKIKPEDISVLYVDPNDESVEGSAIKVLRLGEDSYFKDTWPGGFFDEGLKERLPDDDEFSTSDEGTNVLDKLFSE